MKKSMVKTSLAVALLIGGILGQGAGDVAVVEAAAAPATKAQPVMTDNLAKYGLKKDVELPVTVTAGGLSYTLEKIMIFDVKSKDAQALIKKYGYGSYGDYFIWTKITIENKGSKVIEISANDPNPKWIIGIGDGGILDPGMPRTKVREINSKEALWGYSLKPGQKLSTYQGFFNLGPRFDYLVISLNVKGSSAQKYIVNRKEE